LTATYQSSFGETSDMSNGADTSSSRCTVVLKAPASAPGRRSGFGAADRAEVKLAVSDVDRGGAGFGGLDAGRPLADGGPAGGTLATLDSVTAARTSIRWPHLRHFIRTVLPTTFSSAIWYLALH
jgi:hypothetical protein